LKPYVWWLNLYYSWLNHHFWWITSAVSTQTILTFTASELRSRSYHVAHAEWHRLRMGRGVWYNLWPDVLVHQCPLAVLPVLNVTNGFIYFYIKGFLSGVIIPYMGFSHWLKKMLVLAISVEFFSPIHRYPKLLPGATGNP
jgi:hypothetical protein